MSVARHVVAYCDQHLLAGQQVPADPYRACKLAVGDLSITVDLCQECQENFTAPLRALQNADRSREEAQAAVKPQASVPASERAKRVYKQNRGPSHTCDLCGKHVDYMARFVHIRGAHPELVPMLPCPHCDVTDSSCTGLSTHMRTQHPEHYVSKARAYAFALDELRPKMLAQRGLKDVTFTPLPAGGS
jgi:hypothetical protein